MKDKGREQCSQNRIFFRYKILRMRFCSGCGTNKSYRLSKKNPFIGTALQCRRSFISVIYHVFNLSVSSRPFLKVAPALIGKVVALGILYARLLHCFDEAKVTAVWRSYPFAYHNHKESHQETMSIDMNVQTYLEDSPQIPTPTSKDECH